ncbi:MAG: hypothetical protein A2174_01095 [Candidatus Portnoybacteria bacterium RBG_13_41_18]|uniref:Nitroreductase domain-containing protein n=1 Tax=Candidatus Portnoybacteria bacterium RBG_13_41_18 TaxID=1801991 RepID=A0A1G2F559_9BACT|nr:MAG: hypothetical protein A2174_01095 [Candidatus Portnoybacteria bacterium RBG_13_41_18]
MILKEILNRRSIRKFKPDAVSEESITEIIKAAQFAPTAKNNKALEFIVVRDQETKNKMFEIIGQDFIKEAPILILPVIEEENSVAPTQDISLATAQMFLQATSLGLGSVWKNVAKEDWSPRVKALLGIPESFILINLIPIGYPAEIIPPHNDEEFDTKKIHPEKW